MRPDFKCSKAADQRSLLVSGPGAFVTALWSVQGFANGVLFWLGPIHGQQHGQASGSIDCLLTCGLLRQVRSDLSAASAGGDKVHVHVCMQGFVG